MRRAMVCGATVTSGLTLLYRIAQDIAPGLPAPEGKEPDMADNATSYSKGQQSAAGGQPAPVQKPGQTTESFGHETAGWKSGQRGS